MDFSQRLKTLRQALSITQQGFADSLGLKQSTIASFETDRTSPSDRTISDICREFNVSETWLRTGEGEMFVPLSRDDQIASFVGDVMRDQEPDFRRRFIAALTKFSPDDWAALERMLLILSKEMDKEEKGQ